MDPDKLLYVDKRAIFMIRFTGLMFSLLLAVQCVLIYAGIVSTQDAVHAACLPIAAGFTLLGVTQAFWEPYTKRKVLLYLDAYLIAAALLSTLVTGFSTLVFLGWMLVLVVNIIYAGAQKALIGYCLMVFSLLLWLSLNIRHHSRSEIYGLYLSVIASGALLAIISSLWRLTYKSIQTMENLHAKEDIEHSQLTSLINSMADGVIAVDTDAKVVLYNAAALNVLDLNSSMQGKSLKRFIHLVNQNQQAVDVVKLVNDTKLANVSRDLRIMYEDGSFANLYLSIAPVHLGYGKEGNHGFVLMLRDITREKSLEEERDEFISVVSHELRTPIAISEGNISNAQVIADKTGDIKQIKDSLSQAHNQVIFLADMINDLATLSRAERGKLVLDIEEIDVAALVQELAEAYQSDAQAKSLRIKTDVEKGIPTLSSSRLYVREVLQNFMTNAIKYTEKGSVTLNAKQVEKGLEFAVVDTGIGISKSDQERVFDKFFRSEDYRTRQSNGTGLGLYVTMKLARLIHADIAVQSELNKGSTFVITIPDIKQSEAGASKPVVTAE
jgi:PAS domain S-box-containing protein